MTVPRGFGLPDALFGVMIAMNVVYNKMASSPGTGGADSLNQPAPQINPARQISSAVAHDLNNLLTVVQVYSEKLVRQGKYPELQPQLTSIWEAAKRAAMVVREAAAQNAKTAPVAPAQTGLKSSVKSPVAALPVQ